MSVLVHCDGVLLVSRVQNEQSGRAPVCYEDGPIVGRILYDGISNVITGVSGIASPGVEAVSNIINQQICPDYWVPDDQISVRILLVFLCSQNHL